MHDFVTRFSEPQIPLRRTAALATLATAAEPVGLAGTATGLAQAPHLGLGEVQAEINAQFTALARQGLVPITSAEELRARMCPSEVCYAADNLPTASPLSIGRCDPAERGAMGTALQQAAAEKDNCWTVAHPAKDPYIGSASAPFETLLARWLLVPEAQAALLSAPPDPKARTILLVGDSTMRMMAEALTCTLLRQQLAPFQKGGMDAAGWKIEYLPYLPVNTVQ